MNIFFHDPACIVNYRLCCYSEENATEYKLLLDLSVNKKETKYAKCKKLNV